MARNYSEENFERGEKCYLTVRHLWWVYKHRDRSFTSLRFGVRPPPPFAAPGAWENPTLMDFVEIDWQYRNNYSYVRKYMTRDDDFRATERVNNLETWMARK